jgi:hypothetical protein
MICFKVLYSTLLRGSEEIHEKPKSSLREKLGSTCNCTYLKFGMADDEISKCYFIHGTLTRNRDLFTIHEKKLSDR